MIAIPQALPKEETINRFFGLNLLFTFVLILHGTVFAQENPHGEMKWACNDCHTAAGWDSVSFDHSRTGFVLDGQHHGRECMECHDITNFLSEENARCRDCHTDYHKDRIGQDCATCHQAGGWQLFNSEQAHQNTTFKLLGRHAALDCASCHRGELEEAYLKTSVNCITCHDTEFGATSNPNHRRIGFDMQCENCHSFFSWTPAQFPEHDAYFPISSGSHAGEWRVCEDCHINAADYKTFSCFEGCHVHSESKTRGQHGGVGGFVYESIACYSCHPSGSGGD